MGVRDIFSSSPHHCTVAFLTILRTPVPRRRRYITTRYETQQTLWAASDLPGLSFWNRWPGILSCVPRFIGSLTILPTPGLALALGKRRTLLTAISADTMRRLQSSWALVMGRIADDLTLPQGRTAMIVSCWISADCVVAHPILVCSRRAVGACTVRGGFTIAFAECFVGIERRQGKGDGIFHYRISYSLTPGRTVQGANGAHRVRILFSFVIGPSDIADDLTHPQGSNSDSLALGLTAKGPPDLSRLHGVQYLILADPRHAATGSLCSL